MITEDFNKRINLQIQRALDCHPKANVEVLRFIYEFIEQRDRDENSLSDVIIDKFVAGYCYYFALMLRDAFDGELMWVKGRGHIVYYDYQSKLCYDICGVYVPDISQDGTGEPVPLDMLKGGLESFKHRGHDEDVKNAIDFYCKATNTTLNSLMCKVCNSFLKEERVFPEPCLGDLYRLWDAWFENNITMLEWMCLEALKGKFCREFSPDDVVFDVLANEMTDLVLLQSQDWIDSHPKSRGGATANCGMLYYCELLDTHFRFDVTRWSTVRYEVLVEHTPLKSQQETLQQLNQFQEG